MYVTERNKLYKNKRSLTWKLTNYCFICVISETTHCRGENIFTIFVCPKKDVGHRLILNLKSLNEHVEYHLFKALAKLSNKVGSNKASNIVGCEC